MKFGRIDHSLLAQCHVIIESDYFNQVVLFILVLL